MCGIIACMGENLEKVLIEGLERLEYRGYDSAGLTILNDNNFITKKALGSVKNLAKLCKDDVSGLGIAHTRWATHGNISIENAHPHFSKDENLALVHNGIIENYQDIKNELTKKGFTFYGKTDSEVIAKYFGEQIDEKVLQEKLQNIKGSYAFAILCKGQNRIYFAKNKSPLYVLEGKMLASDPSCFVGYGEKYITIEDNEYGYFDGNEIKIFKDGRQIEKEAKQVDFDFAVTGKMSYDHYMIKEIYDSKNVINGIKERYSSASMIKAIKSINLDKFNRIYFIACGTAYNSGLVAGEIFRKAFNKDVYVEKAGEFKYFNFPIDENSLCFFISQSGETADTLLTLDYVKERGAKCVAIVNTVYSTLAQKCDLVFPICAGQEKAVASTKAYFGQILCLDVIASIILNKPFKKELDEFSMKLDFGNDEKIKEIAKDLKNREKLFFIGRGIDYLSALEASLKMKEISYIFAYGESSAELKHGSLALVEKGVDAVLIATQKDTLAKNLASAEEIHSRGGKIILISPFDVNSHVIDYKIKIKPCNERFLNLQTMIVLQKLAYFTAVARGLNPDKPRNLAKSVTVE